MLKFIAILLIIFISQSALAADYVILLHGLGRTSYSMSNLESSLKERGYTVVNNSYPSREKSIADLSTVVGEHIETCLESKPEHIHFVTHSLGGILVRKYFQNHTAPEAKRIVMLGPPNHGSEVTSAYKNEWWYQWFTGPAGQELGIEPDSTPNQLGKIPLEIGIIAGTETLDP